MKECNLKKRTQAFCQKANDSLVFAMAIIKRTQGFGMRSPIIRSGGLNRQMAFLTGSSRCQEVLKGLGLLESLGLVTSAATKMKLKACVLKPRRFAKRRYVGSPFAAF